MSDLPDPQPRFSNPTTIHLPDAEATHQLGVRLGQSLPAGSVLLLEGELGSGKTTLVQGIGVGLGIPDAIDSPTFTLINEYSGGRVPLYHLDLYRLNPAETAALYLETYWEGVETEPGIVAIEWAERLPYKPPSYLVVQLTYSADFGRMATLSAIDPSNLTGNTMNDFLHGFFTSTLQESQK